MISPPDGFTSKSHITIQGQRIESSTSLKLLGFIFGQEPNVSNHIEEIKRKFRARFWSIIHLRRSGFVGWDLFRFFIIFVRPIIEYCCVVYHPMLTVSQSHEIERLQKQAAKLCFGWDKSYQVICAEQNIVTLEERRVNYIDNFIKKTIDNPRFRDSWYPLREEAVQSVRNRRPFVETRARTERYYRSPLAFLRRRANDMTVGINE